MTSPHVEAAAGQYVGPLQSGETLEKIEGKPAVSLLPKASCAPPKRAGDERERRTILRGALTAVRLRSPSRQRRLLAMKFNATKSRTRLPDGLARSKCFGLDAILRAAAKALVDAADAKLGEQVVKRHLSREDMRRASIDGRFGFFLGHHKIDEDNLDVFGLFPAFELAGEFEPIDIGSALVEDQNVGPKQPHLDQGVNGVVRQPPPHALLVLFEPATESAERLRVGVDPKHAADCQRCKLAGHGQPVLMDESSEMVGPDAPVAAGRSKRPQLFTSHPVVD